MRYFISYTRTDSEFVLRLAQDLRAAGVGIWLDQLDIPAGSLWDREVEEALDGCDGLLVVLSPTSTASRNVLDEVSYALDKGKSVVPVLTEQATEIPFRLRRLQHVDFTGDYDSALQLLVAALGDPLSQTGVLGIIETQRLLSQRAERAADPAASEHAAPPPAARAAPSRARRPGRWSRRRVATAAAALLSVLLVLIFAWARTRPGAGPPSDDSRPERLAVRPFIDFTEDPERGFLSELVTEEVTMHLSRVAPERLTVKGRASAARFSAHPIPEVGRELDVTFVVDGTIAVLGGQTRLTAALIRVSDETTVWSNSFSGAPTDLLELGRKVAEALSIELTPQETAAAAGAIPANTEAHRAYLLGRSALQQRTAKQLEVALERFEEAIGHDPDYALAHSGLADAYALLARYGARPASEAMPAAIRAAEKALDLNEGLAEAHASLAYAVMHYEWDWGRAGTAFRRAIELNPNYVTAHQWYARYLTSLGRFDEAIAQAKAAAELDPASPIVLAAVGYAHYFAGQYERAIDYCERALALDGNFTRAFWNLGLVYERQGMFDEAIAALEEARVLAPRSSMILSTLGYVYARAGRDTEAREILGSLLARRERGEYVQSFDLAVLHSGLGEKGAALDLLETAFRERSARLVELGSSRQFDQLRDEPRFDTLLSRVRLRSDAPTPLEGFDEPARAVFDAELSTGTLVPVANPAPSDVNRSSTSGRYHRNPTELFDVVFYRTEAIDDAEPFLTGQTKLSIDLYTAAPTGTEILLQLESGETTAGNFPAGRHSRFQTHTTAQGRWQSLEFTLLDRPDRGVPHDAIDHLVILFAPNTTTGDVYTFDNLSIQDNAP